MEMDYEILWQECLNVFRDNLNIETYRSWFEPIKPISYDDEKLTLMLPSPFFYEYLEENFIDLIKKTLRKVFGPKIKLDYKITINSSSTQKNLNKSTMTIPGNLVSTPENNPITIVKSNVPYNPFLIPGIQKVRIETNLKKELNFDRYVVGKGNRVAATIGRKIAEKPGQTAFNPLFVHGITGNGKTHLVNAIGMLAKEMHPDKVVFYETSNDFQNKYQKSVQDKNIQDFLNLYKNIDILIIDDIQDMTGKEGTQKIFFNIFNLFHQNNKQLIFTADRPPVELDGFFDRLLTRFKWGMTTEIEIPDYETRLEILKQKAHDNGCSDIPDKVFELIAESINSSIRELEGALLSIITYATVETSKISIELAKKVLKNLTKEKKIEQTPEKIVNSVAQYFNLTEKALKAKTRKREVVTARHFAMFYVKSLTNMSLTSIGQMFGGRDHATVLYAAKVVSDLSQTDREFKKIKEDLDRLLSY